MSSAFIGGKMHDEHISYDHISDKLEKSIQCKRKAAADLADVDKKHFSIGIEKVN